MKKKLTFQKISSIFLSIITIILVGVLIMVVVTKITNKVPSFFGYSILRIVSPSMEEEIPVGECILVKKADVQRVKEDDIISFFSADPVIKDRLNTHRVVEIKNDNGNISFITKGDNNSIKDKYPVTTENFYGIYQQKLPVITVISKIVVNPLFFLAIIVLEIISLIWRAKGLKQESDEELIAREVEKLKANDKTNVDLEDGSNGF